MKDWNKAKKFYERALQLNQTLFGPEHESVAANYNGYVYPWGSFFISLDWLFFVDKHKSETQPLQMNNTG